MTLKTVVAVGIACVLVGLLIGYVFWGLGSDKLTRELAEMKAQLTAEPQRAEERQRRVEAQLKQAESRLEKVAEDLEFERQRRVKLELLLSEGRK